MKLLKTFALGAVMVPALATMALASEWTLDPAHTSADFTIKHLVVTTVHGQFTKVSGTVNLDDKDVTKSQIEILIDAKSVDTREPKRDAHLRSPDFFDVDKFPHITFKSTKIAKAGGKDKFKVTGDLTLHGVTKSVVLDVQGPGAPIKTPFGNTVRPGVVAKGKINRKDFGLNWNKALEAGGLLVGEEVSIEVDTELAPKEPVAPAAPAAAPPAAPAPKAK